LYCSNFNSKKPPKKIFGNGAMTNQVMSLMKISSSDLQVEYELISSQNSSCQEIAEIDQRLDEISSRVSKLDNEINYLTNHADGLDYAVAVASGILTGICDSFFVGEIDWKEELRNDAQNAPDNLLQKTRDKFDKIVIEKAGYNTSNYDSLGKDEKESLLGKAISKLESKYPLPSDNSWKTPGLGNSVSSPRRHHIDDFCHHPTPIGYIACVISVLFKTAVFVDKNGRWHFRWANTNKSDMLWLWGSIILTAFLQWVVTLAERKYKEEQYEEMPKPLRILLRTLAASPAAIQFLLIFNKWAGHLCSDIAGSSSTPGKGMGIPGLILSSLKELLSIPPLNLIPGLHKQLDFLFIAGVDARMEAAALPLIGKQMLPVLLNEVLIRGFYFVSRLIREAKQHDESWNEYDWREILPFNNRTIVRMLTIAHGTFVAVDLADAGIRTAIKNGSPQNPKFWADFVMRINFVGVGRFTVAVFSDVKMGIKRYARVSERIDLNSKMLNFYNAKIYYKQADMWVAAENSEIATQEVCALAQKTVFFFQSSLEEIKSNLNAISDYIPGIDKNNPGLRQEIITLLDD